MRTKRTHSKVVFDDEENEVCRPMTACESASTQDASDYASEEEDNCGDGIYTKEELDAAEVIMALSTADQALPPVKRTRRGSKY